MPGNEKAPVKLSLALDYQQDIFHELREEDELVILARGLGLLRIVSNLLHSYDAAGHNLVIVLGADERENTWLGEAVAEHAAVSNAPKARGLNLVQTDLMTAGTREQLYAQGGLFSITSRILVVDFLSGLLNPATVTGIVALHAEKIPNTSLEAFIIRIFRQQNKKGFLKAFSDVPEPFATGFQPLTNSLKALFLRRPALWPRFHVTIAKSLEGKRKAEVIELEVPMTQGMKDIQNAVLECVEVSVGELKKANMGLDVEEWNVDSALHRNFDTFVRRQLDPVWHRTTFRTRQIVRDLTTLRNMLENLLTNDAVSFNKYLDTVLASSAPPPGSTRLNQSPWLFLDAANVIFETARRRVYTGKVKDSDPAIGQNALPESMSPVLEEMPKWHTLSEILAEIETDFHLNPIPNDDSNSTVLIMAGDQGTCRQIREYLQSTHAPLVNEAEDNEADDGDEPPSARLMMRRRLRNYLVWRRDFAKVKNNLFSENEKSINGANDQKGGSSSRSRAPLNKRRRVRGGGTAGASSNRAVNGSVGIAADREAHIASLMAELQPTEIEGHQKEEIAADPLVNMEEYYKLFEMKELLLIHPYDGDKDDLILEEVRPRYIIMYEPDPAFIRRVEVYRSSHTDRNVRVYFLYYKDSVEERRFLSALRREKDAFTALIRERSVSTCYLRNGATC